MDAGKGQATFRCIRYADDFLILVAGTRAQAEAIKKQTAEFMAEQMRLTLSPEKTAITHVDDGFDFLGWRVKRVPRPGRAPVAITFPSDRALGDIKHRIKTLTKSNMVNLSLDELIRALNPNSGVRPTTTATVRRSAASDTSATTCGGESSAGFATSTRT